MIRTYDATHLNTIANHPDVRPWLLGEGPVDLTPIVASPFNVAVEAEAGGFVAVRYAEGCYDIHSLFLPDHGSAAIRLMREGLTYLFTHTDARRLTTRVPDANRAAQALAAMAGFSRWFATDDSTAVQALDVDTWIVRAEATAAAPSVFRGDGPSGAAYAGALALMIRAGNLAKALTLYNHWASAAGTTPITLLAVFPPLLDLGDGRWVEVRDGVGIIVQEAPCQPPSSLK